MNNLYPLFKKYFVIVSTILLLLISAAPFVSHADIIQTGTYTLRYYTNGGYVTQKYSNLQDCQIGKQTWQESNSQAQCIPDTTTNFYCYQVPYKSSLPSGPYNKYCYLDQNTCEFDFNQNTNEAANATDNCNVAQSCDDSGLIGDISSFIPPAQQQTYQFLAPLQDANGQSFTGSTADGKSIDLVSYIKGMYRFIIALAGIIAVIMIIVGGLMYMSTDAISRKRTGKDIIIRTLWGILLLFGSYLILYSINPTLVKIQTPDIGANGGLNSGGGTNTPGAGTTNNTCGATTPPPTPTGPKTSWCIYPAADMPADTNLGKIPLPRVCKTSETECQTSTLSIGSGYNPYTVSVINNPQNPSGACYTSATGNYVTSQWCIDISIQGIKKSDCQAGSAYKPNPAALSKANIKVQDYNNGKYGSVTILHHPDIYTSSYSDSGTNYYIDSNKELCISVKQADGTVNQDCSTSQGTDAVMGIILNTDNENTCDQIAGSYATGSRHTPSVVYGNGDGTYSAAPVCK